MPETEKKPQTNKEYAKTNKKFIEACQAVGIPPTSRQASKYRRGFGKAANHN